jgi:heterotetrameric sarcosine oxidase gamma subunit
LKLQPQSALGGLIGATHAVIGFRSDGAILQGRADIGCVLLTAAARSAEVISSAILTSVVELPLAPGAIKAREGRAAVWLSPRSWLIQCGIEEEMGLVAGLNQAFPDKRAHAVPFTDSLCWLELSGRAGIDLLTEGGFVSLERDGLPVGHAKRTLIAQTAVVVVRESERSWLLAVERSRARYFVEWLSAAAGSND